MQAPRLYHTLRVDHHYHLAEERSPADRATFVLRLTEGSADIFGPLKAVLESVSVVYAKHQVCFDTPFVALL